jgi:plastocyanin
MEEKQISEKQGGTPAGGSFFVWVTVAVIVIIVIAVYFLRPDSKKPTPASNQPTAQSPVSSLPDSTQNAGQANQMANTEKTFDISAKPFEFSVKEMRVKKGDKVKINLTVTQGMHDWVIDEFNARTKIIQAGATDSVEFVVDKTGTFEYYCSVPAHRQQGMVGKLIVE